MLYHYKTAAPMTAVVFPLILQKQRQEISNSQANKVDRCVIAILVIKFLLPMQKRSVLSLM